MHCGILWWQTAEWLFFKRMAQFALIQTCNRPPQFRSAPKGSLPESCPPASSFSHNPTHTSLLSWMAEQPAEGWDGGRHILLPRVLPCSTLTTPFMLSKAEPAWALAATVPPLINQKPLEPSFWPSSSFNLQCKETLLSPCFHLGFQLAVCHLAVTEEIFCPSQATCNCAKCPHQKHPLCTSVPLLSHLLPNQKPISPREQVTQRLCGRGSLLDSSVASCRCSLMCSGNWGDISHPTHVHACWSDWNVAILPMFGVSNKLRNFCDTDHRWAVFVMWVIWLRFWGSSQSATTTSELEAFLWG